MNMENESFLRQARKAVPFLNEVPDEIYFQLDPGELCLPEGVIAEARAKLEEMLGHHVMTYKKEVFLQDIPIAHHLCAHVQGAELREEQMEILHEFEQRYGSLGVTFVVYAKPLKLIPVENSYIFRWLNK